MGSNGRCSRTGEELFFSENLNNNYLNEGFSLPKISYFEQLRNLLSCVPNTDYILNEDSISYTDKNGKIDYITPPFSCTEKSSWLPYFEQCMFQFSYSKEELSPDVFIKKFTELYGKYIVANQSSKSFEHPIHYACLDMKHSLDCFSSIDLKNSYECTFCSYSEKLYFSKNSHNCRNSYFLDSCTNCTNCMFCYGLSDAEYYVFNTKVSKDEYETFYKEASLNSPIRLEHAKERFSNFLLGHPVPSVYQSSSKNTQGNYIYKSKNIDTGFFIFNSENLNVSMSMLNSQNVTSGAFCGSNILDSFFPLLVGANGSNLKMVYASKGNIDNCIYCIGCENSSHLFGCVGLKDKKYCILNTQLSEGEYFNLRDKIIKFLKDNNIWGSIDFFRTMIIPYNMSLANIIMPLGRIQAHLFGHIWREDSRTSFSNLSNLESTIGDNIKICEINGLRFEHSQYEIDFCSEFNIALQERSPQQRFKERVQSASIGSKKTLLCPFTGEKIESWYSGIRTVLSNNEYEKYRVAN